MKLEDLHKAKIRKSKFINDAYEIVGRNGSVARIVYSGRYDDSGFDDRQTALLAAARFLASEVMYAELQTEYEFLVSVYNNSNVPVSIQDRAEQRAKEISAILSMADNTNEIL